MLGECMWLGCNEKAQFETPLDFPKIFLCPFHFDEHKRLAKRNHIGVVHPSFTQRQRNRHLKKEFR